MWGSKVNLLASILSTMWVLGIKLIRLTEQAPLICLMALPTLFFLFLPLSKLTFIYDYLWTGMHACLCVPVCVYWLSPCACLCVWIHTYVCVCVCACQHGHKSLCVHSCLRVCVCMFACVLACVSLHVCVYIVLYIVFFSPAAQSQTIPGKHSVIELSPVFIPFLLVYI